MALKSMLLPGQKWGYRPRDPSCLITQSKQRHIHRAKAWQGGHMTTHWPAQLIKPLALI